MWHIHTMDYYLAMKKNEDFILAIRVMKNKNIMLSERSC